MNMDQLLQLRDRELIDALRAMPAHEAAGVSAYWVLNESGHVALSAEALEQLSPHDATIWSFSTGAHTWGELADILKEKYAKALAESRQRKAARKNQDRILALADYELYTELKKFGNTTVRDALFIPHWNALLHWGKVHVSLSYQTLVALGETPNTDQEWWHIQSEPIAIDRSMSDLADLIWRAERALLAVHVLHAAGFKAVARFGYDYPNPVAWVHFPSPPDCDTVFCDPPPDEFARAQKIVRNQVGADIEVTARLPWALAKNIGRIWSSGEPD